MDTAIKAAAWAYFCPICGVSLDRFDFDKAPEEYFCPVCSSQQRPSRVAARVEWEFPN